MMGVTLVPRKKGVKVWEAGYVLWTYLLESGVGLSIGVARCSYPKKIYLQDMSKPNPTGSDGFYVSADRARAMSFAASTLADGMSYGSITLGDVEMLSFLKEPTCRDHIRRFAEFSANSSGFWIY